MPDFTDHLCSQDESYLRAFGNYLREKAIGEEFADEKDLKVWLVNNLATPRVIEVLIAQFRRFKGHG